MTLGDDLGGITLGDDLGGMTCGGGRVDLAPLPVRPARAGDRLAAHRQLRHQDLSQGAFFLFFYGLVILVIIKQKLLINDQRMNIF